MNLIELLRAVASGAQSPEAAAERLTAGLHADLGFACVDLDRRRRRGLAEVIYCSGKTAEQVVRIMTALANAGQDVLATRATPGQMEVVRRAHPRAVCHEQARAITLQVTESAPRIGRVAVVCAGTSDIPVGEEAALTAEFMGARVDRVYDVGVAGLHRLLPHLETLAQARVAVVAAGMEGALPSVLGGLVNCPVIAVPTSVGYGVNFQGLAALLAMLNSCVPGITVVNIDNGFGAGVSAALINRLGAPS